MAEALENVRAARCEVATFIAAELVAIRFESAQSAGALWSLSLDLAERVAADLLKAVAHVREQTERMRRAPS